MKRILREAKEVMRAGAATKGGEVQHQREVREVIDLLERSQDVRPVAEAIARVLLTSGNGVKADRLVLTIDGPAARTLGGWSEQAIADQVAEVLKRAGPLFTGAPLE